MADEHRQIPALGSSLGYAIVLLGAALFVAACFLPYYGYSIPPPPAGTISLYQATTSGPAGGSDLGAVLYLFGGVVPIVAVAITGLARGGRRTDLPLVLWGAIAAWSLTWIGILIQVGSFGVSLDIGFWLQAVSIGVAVIGTIILGFGKGSEVKDSHDRYATEQGVDTGA
jgi:hypothetical protein